MRVAVPGRLRITRPWMSLVLPCALVAAVLVADTLEGPKTAFVGVLVAAPMLSAVFGTPLTVGLVGAATLVSAALFGMQAEDGQVAAQGTRLVVILVLTVVAALVAATRVRSEVRLADADRVVAAVTEAIIRPLPGDVGGVGLASRYLGADAEADVGGDFYEVLDTPHGVRVVIGDVRGKGLSAVRMANYVLGAFRAAGRTEARLEDVAVALDGIVATEGDTEDFVTALLLQVRDSRLEGVSCGHPQPQLLVGDGFVEGDLPVDVPLGLGAGHVAVAPLAGATTGVLLHSDGLTEARTRTGVFLDLPHVLTTLQGARGEQLLGGLVTAVRAHVGGRLRDDVALLWLDVRGVRGPATTAAATSRTTGSDATSAAAPGVVRQAVPTRGR